MTSPGTVLASEDFTGTNGAVWNASRWTRYLTGTGSATIQSNRGALTTVATAYGAGAIAAFTAVAPRADSEFYLETVLGASRVEQYLVVGLRSNNTATSGSFPTNGYFVEISFSGQTATLRRGVNSVYTSLVTDASIPLTLSATYGIRFRVEGNRIRFRMWNRANTEPTTWLIDHTDATPYSTAGVPILTAQNGNAATARTWTIDNVALSSTETTATTGSGTVALTGSGTLALSNARPTAAGTLALTGSGTLALTAGLRYPGTGVYPGGTTYPGEATATVSPTAVALSGSGTLTISGVASTAPPAAGGTPTYRYWRFQPTSMRVPPEQAYGFQISEFQLLNGTTRLAGATATSPGGIDAGPGEAASFANDNNLFSKWLNVNDLVGYLLLDFGSPVSATGYRIGTAGDDPGRDPTAWYIDGSADGTNWTRIDTRTGYNGSQERYVYWPDFAFTIAPTTPAYTGTVALTGSGTLALTNARATAAGAISLTGAGTVAVTGKMGWSSALALSGSGITALSNGKANAAQSVPLTGSGTLGMTGQASSAGVGSLSLNGSGVLAGAAQQVTVTASRALTGSGALTLVGEPRVSAALALSSSGALSVTGKAGKAGTLDLTGSGALAATGTFGNAGTFAVASVGVLTIIPGESGTSAAIVSNGTGSLVLTTGQVTSSGAMSLTGSGTLSSTAVVFLKDKTATVGLAGSGTLTIAATRVTASASVALTSSGQLSLSGSKEESARFGTLALTGAGTLSVNGRSTGRGVLALTGNGVLTIEGLTDIIVINRALAPIFFGQGSRFARAFRAGEAVPEAVVVARDIRHLVTSVYVRR